MKNKMRIIHRYLGFFLAGIMMIYALSGVLMIFRSTDFLKFEKTIERQLDPGLRGDALGGKLRIRGLKVTEETPEAIVFKEGRYDKASGLATYQVKELPVILQKFEKMHKATTKDPLFFLNIFFGGALLFFAVSSFFMFAPGSTIFRKGLYFTAAGVILAVVMVWV